MFDIKSGVFKGLFIALLSLPAAAFNDDEGFYTGIDFRALSTEEATLGKATMGNIGLTAGARISGNTSIEIHYSTTISEDEMAQGIDISADTMGLFAVFKTNTDIYVKGRIGVSQVDLNMNRLGNDFSEKTAGIAVGVGLGTKLGEKIALELEYIKLPSLDYFRGEVVDVDNEAISLGMTYNF